MMRRDGSKQLKMTFLTLEELMPESHFLRNLEQCVDFSFIYDIVEPLYAKVGRPSVDPVLLVKMLLLGYLYGIPSERKLEQEVRINIAFRCFWESTLTSLFRIILPFLSFDAENSGRQPCFKIFLTKLSANVWLLTGIRKASADRFYTHSCKCGKGKTGSYRGSRHAF